MYKFDTNHQYRLTDFNMPAGQRKMQQQISAQGGENISASVTANTEGVITKDLLDEMDEISENLVVHSAKTFPSKTEKSG